MKSYAPGIAIGIVIGGVLAVVIVVGSFLFVGNWIETKPSNVNSLSGGTQPNFLRCRDDEIFLVDEPTSQIPPDASCVPIASLDFTGQQAAARAKSLCLERDNPNERVRPQIEKVPSGYQLSCRM